MSEVTMTDRSRPRWGLLAAVIFGVLALMAVVGNLLPDETPRLPGAATTSTPSATPTTPAPTTEPPAEAPTETPAPDADLAARVETATLTNYGLDSWGYRGSDGWWVYVTGMTSPTSGVVVVDVQDTGRDLLDRAARGVMHGACRDVPDLDLVQARGADGAWVTLPRRDAPLCD